MRGRTGLAGDLGLQALQSSYLPQQQLISSLMPGLEASRLESALRTTGLGLGTGLAESTLEAQLGYNALANALRQQQFQGLFDLLKGEQETAAAQVATGSSPTVGNESNADIVLNNNILNEAMRRAAGEIDPSTGQFGFGGSLGNILNNKTANNLFNITRR